MTPALAFAPLLTLLAPGLTVLAAGAALSARVRWLPPTLLALALVADLTVSVTAQAITSAVGSAESALFTWSPLGLYGVNVLVRRGAHLALLTCPALFLGWLGLTLAERRRRWFSGRAAESPATRAVSGASLLALAAGLWSIRAGDFVSFFAGIAVILLASAAVLWSTAGLAAAGRRVVVSHLTLAGLLTAGLLLGKVNGHFQLGGLSSSGFTDATFAGLIMAAAALAAVPPLHGWLLRSARGALTPALAAVGLTAASALLLTAFLVTELGVTWQGVLRTLGWIAALLGTGVALTRRRPALALAGAWVTRAGTLFLAASIFTPASLAAALAFAAGPLVAHGALWLTASIPWGGHLRARTGAVPPLRTPGFWLNLLLLAMAVGLPPTVGGTLRSLLEGSITSWPSGDQLLRVPLALGDVATLIAGGGVLWSARYAPPLAGARGWVVVAVLAALLTLPFVVPQLLLAPWLDAATAAAVGTSGAPLTLAGPLLPSAWSIVLALVSAWALAQRLRGREWLPTLALAVLGVLALGWREGRRRWRARGLNVAPAALGRGVWQRAQTGAERVLLGLRPFEERYYAGTAILLAVAIIFVLGR